MSLVFGFLILGLLSFVFGAYHIYGALRLRRASKTLKTDAVADLISSLAVLIFKVPMDSVGEFSLVAGLIFAAGGLFSLGYALFLAIVQ
ncbi:MAG: hypothetical protein AB1540_03745 [Bdellovibrionota bacterium]